MDIGYTSGVISWSYDTYFYLKGALVLFMMIFQVNLARQLRYLSFGSEQSQLQAHHDSNGCQDRVPVLHGQADQRPKALQDLTPGLDKDCAAE